MKASSLSLLIALALLIGLISPAAAQDNLSDCEVPLSSLPDQGPTFFRNANQRVEELAGVIDNGIKDGDVRKAAFDLIRWATLADLSLNVIYADIELPECSEVRTLRDTYQDIIDGTYRLGGHLYVGIDMAGLLPSERVVSVLPDRVRDLAIEIAVWKVVYEKAA